MKSRGTARKTGKSGKAKAGRAGRAGKTDRRLLKESLLLSRLGRLSSRMVESLKNSASSRVLTGAPKSDEALAAGFIGSGLQRAGALRRFVRKAKARFAISAEESVIGGLYRAALRRVICTPVGILGAFAATFGIYVCLVYFLKVYGFGALREVSESSFYTGCALMALSLPLLLSRKPLVNTLRESAFASELFRGVFDLDAYPGAYPGARQRVSVGAALISGSVFGVLTFFCGEKGILVCIAAAVFLLPVFHSPEFGLLSAAALFAFCPEKWLSALIIAALCSYVVKALRGKRNFRAGAANVFALILGLCFLFAWARGGGAAARRAFCMTALYLLAANLLTTSALLKKCALMLSGGLGVTVLIYALQIFSAAFEGKELLPALTEASSVFGSAKEFSGFLALSLPFLYCKASDRSFAAKLCCAVFALCSAAYAAATGNAAYAVLMALASALYFAVKNRALLRGAVLCFGLPAAALYFADVPLSFAGTSLRAIAEGWGGAFRAGLSDFVFGAGMSEKSAALAFAGDSHSLYLQTFAECGAAGLLLLASALYFAFQRVYPRLSPTGSANRAVTAAAGASAIAGLLLGMGTNLWANTETCCVFWLALGLAGAAYETRKTETEGIADEHRG